VPIAGRSPQFGESKQRQCPIKWCVARASELERSFDVGSGILIFAA